YSSPFLFNHTATTDIYTLSLHDALPIFPTGPPAKPRGFLEAPAGRGRRRCGGSRAPVRPGPPRRSETVGQPARPVHCRTRGWCRSEEHTSELQSRENLVCRLLLEKKNKK